jgi:hypothetical protein
MLLAVDEGTRMPSDPRMRRLSFILAFACFMGACLVADGARADDPRSAYLVKLLQGSSQFRVRAQAAISLGAVQSSSPVVQALTQALKDPHPAVRAASATSLGRVGDRSSMAALRALDRDAEEPVRAAAKSAIAKLDSDSGAVQTAVSTTTEPTPVGPALYYVQIAQPASRSGGVEARTLEQTRLFIKQRVGQLSGVVIAPDTERTTDADKVLKTRKLKGFYLDSSITSVERKPDGGTRVAVSVIVATYPGRDMRAIMQGAATVSGGGSDYTQAIEGAFSGALRQLPQALAR